MGRGPRVRNKLMLKLCYKIYKEQQQQQKDRRLKAII